MMTYNSFFQAKKIISSRIGIVQQILKLPRLFCDPLIVSFGVYVCNTNKLKGEVYPGRSGGANHNFRESFMSTIGEAVERYCSTFYDISQMQKNTFRNISNKAIHPSKFALFHNDQYKFFRENNYPMYSFDEDVEVYWDECHNLIN